MILEPLDFSLFSLKHLLDQEHLTLLGDEVLQNLLPKVRVRCGCGCVRVSGGGCLQCGDDELLDWRQVTERTHKQCQQYALIMAGTSCSH